MISSKCTYYSTNDKMLSPSSEQDGRLDNVPTPSPFWQVQSAAIFNQMIAPRQNDEKIPPPSRCLRKRIKIWRMCAANGSIPTSPPRPHPFATAALPPTRNPRHLQVFCWRAKQFECTDRNRRSPVNGERNRVRREGC